MGTTLRRRLNICEIFGEFQACKCSCALNFLYHGIKFMNEGVKVGKKHSHYILNRRRELEHILKEAFYLLFCPFQLLALLVLQLIDIFVGFYLQFVAVDIRTLLPFRILPNFVRIGLLKTRKIRENRVGLIYSQRWIRIFTFFPKTTETIVVWLEYFFISIGIFFLICFYCGHKPVIVTVVNKIRRKCNVHNVIFIKNEVIIKPTFFSIHI